VDNQSAKITHTASVTLAAGPQDVVVEYYQNWGGAKLVFDYTFSECDA
jgi:hypothetical protein